MNYSFLWPFYNCWLYIFKIQKQIRMWNRWLRSNLDHHKLCPIKNVFWTSIFVFVLSAVRDVIPTHREIAASSVICSSSVISWSVIVASWLPARRITLAVTSKGYPRPLFVSLRVSSDQQRIPPSTFRIAQGKQWPAKDTPVHFSYRSG